MSFFNTQLWRLALIGSTALYQVACMAPSSSGVDPAGYTPTSPPSTRQVTVGPRDAHIAPVVIGLQTTAGPLAVIETATASATCPPPASMSTDLRISNLGGSQVTIYCVEHGTSGLGLQFTLEGDTPIDWLSGRLAVAPHSTEQIHVTMSPGPILAGSVLAFVDCFDNEPVATRLRTTTVTRTLVEQDEPCIATQGH